MMANKPFITVSTLMLISLSVFGQYKYKQQLGTLGSVLMPDTPKVQNYKGLGIYLTNYKGVSYLAQASDVSGNLKDLLTRNSPDSLYNSYIKGSLQSTKGKLFYKNKLNINGNEGIEFAYKAILKGQNTYTYQRAVCLNDTILSCAVLAADSLSKDHPALTKFFDGFKVQSASAVKDAEAYSNGVKVGKVIGVLTFIAIFIIIIAGIVLLLRKLTSSKRKKQWSEEDFK
ncbi:hypothetical protein IDJ77_18570 [Mucilaginibacter sp. ZT4R22]|uniref:Uncharacterized protein n=1 Tax=Mucilaginibacter pankratovii TaxID=2772110 RepID=A0ABR7WW47_9SPHI|nr:hypothetical protein [Mucilaginibacter pankratovii]MBD1365827.1 hypothetical protein [Mucilaginibacter pankratovii]